MSKEGIQVDPSKVAAVQDWKRPTNMGEIQSFLGLAGHDRHFVEGFSKILVPLMQLTRKEVKFVWIIEYEKSFLKLKEKLITTPVLTIPNGEDKFVIYSDASGKGLGWVLKQNDKVVTYASR